MKNLAGNQECDKVIKQELLHARIPTVEVPRSESEVAASIQGKLGEFTFRRAWYYYVVNGLVPIEAAKELYADPCGKVDIRATGHCMCPPPEEWVKYRTKDGKEIIPLLQKAEIDAFESRHPGTMKYDKFVFAEDPATAGDGFIDLYHIDSVLGLRIFADILRKHGLA